MAENGDKEQASDLDTKICQQIEYYFGDHNLPRDKFLKEQISLDDGWVPLETMIKFNRLNKLTTDFGIILGALKKSKSGLLEIDEEKSKIRRNPSKPLPEATEEYRNTVKNKSVYIKGFQLDTSLDEIKGWLEDKGPIENIQMRRALDKTFKGSVFIVFETEDAAKKFLEKKDLKYKDSDMIILSKEEYFSKRSEERKQKQSESKAKNKQEKADAQKQAEDAEMKTLEEQTGCLLKFSGDLDNMTSREDLHDLFQDHGEIKWIDFSRGAKEGIILFKSNAKEALEKAKAANKDNLQLKGKDVTWELLEGDVEMAALKKIMEAQQESYNKWKGPKGGKKFKGKGRGGKGNDSSSRKRIQYQGKKKKFESSDEEDAEEGTGDARNGSPKKRQLEEKSPEAPVAKQQKTAEDQ
ncbi:lupus La protein [Rana temporaria]|uniref:lupus La protein n=1 Tax=Rana temporaria TaxID=8407 RepID=UPI001AAC8EAF|nr:lupus La protein [Rana temporaria]